MLHIIRLNSRMRNQSFSIQPTHILCDGAENFMHRHSSYISGNSYSIQRLHGKWSPIVCRRKEKIPFKSLKLPSDWLKFTANRNPFKLSWANRESSNLEWNLTIPVWTKCGVNRLKFIPKVSCRYLSWEKYDWETFLYDSYPEWFCQVDKISLGSRIVEYTCKGGDPSPRTNHYAETKFCWKHFRKDHF